MKYSDPALIVTPSETGKGVAKIKPVDLAVRMQECLVLFNVVAA